MGQLRVLICFAVIAVWCCCLPLCVLASETMSIGAGYSTTSVVSTSYKPNSTSSPEVNFRYSHSLIDRWSLVGQYQMSTDLVFSGFAVGCSFDSELLRAKSGELLGDGSSEIEKVPLWLVRTSAGLGMYRYAQMLESTATGLGTKNKIAVEAQLIGFAFGASVYRFFNESWATFSSLNVVMASANNFSTTNAGLALGVLWKLN